jgi:competence protein ComEC
MPTAFHIYQSLIARISQAFAYQRPQALKWAVIAFASGIAIYFALPSEPATNIVALVTVISAAYAVLMKRTPALRGVLVALSLVLFGLFWASWHTARIDTLMLKRSISPREITGVIEEIEFLKTGQRLTLNHVSVTRLPAEETPYKIRLSMRAKKMPDLKIGMKISLNAGLLPPMGPILKGGFDFSRYFYFRGIGAVGYGLNPIKILSGAQTDGFFPFWQNVRHGLSANIREHMSPDHAAVATGLITGDDSAISKRLYEDLRAANLLHIIAISGSHMVVVAGVMFVTARMVLLLIPGFGLSMRAKKLAAFLTLVAISAYLLVTGIEISALRAYVMMVLILFAVLLGREVRPMRSLMLTAAIMLLYDPSDLLEPGFQLSFAATMAMIAVAEPVIIRFLTRDSTSMIGNWLTALPWIMLISIVAEWVTAPLVLYMFNQFAPYGMLSNMLAGPVVSILIMPAVAVYFLLVPLGLEFIALGVLDIGIGLLLSIARLIASWPGSLQFLPSQPGIAMAIYGLGLVFLCLWKGKARWFAVPIMIASTLSFIWVRPPDLVISQNMRHVMIRIEGEASLAQGRNYAMIPKMLANAMGYYKLPHTKASEAWQCEGKARERRCVLRAFNRVMLFDFTWDKSGVVCDMAAEVKAQILITDAYGIKCKSLKNLEIINPYDRRKNGAYSWWFDPDKKRSTTRIIQGERAWSTLRD